MILESFIFKNNCFQIFSYSFYDLANIFLLLQNSTREPTEFSIKCILQKFIPCQFASSVHINSLPNPISPNYAQFQNMNWQKKKKKPELFQNIKVHPKKFLHCANLLDFRFFLQNLGHILQMDQLEKIPHALRKLLEKLSNNLSTFPVHTIQFKLILQIYCQNNRVPLHSRP